MEVKGHKKSSKSTIWSFLFVTSTGQISINFMDDLKRLAYYMLVYVFDVTSILVWMSCWG
jgi:hypothetical protein